MIERGSGFYGAVIIVSPMTPIDNGPSSFPFDGSKCLGSNESRQEDLGCHITRQTLSEFEAFDGIVVRYYLWFRFEAAGDQRLDVRESHFRWEPNAEIVDAMLLPWEHVLRKDGVRNASGERPPLHFPGWCLKQSGRIC